MKKHLFFLLTALLLFSLVGCAESGTNAQNPASSGSSSNVSDAILPDEQDADTDTPTQNMESAEPSDSEAADEPEAPAQIKLTFDDSTAIVTLYDNEASRGLLAMLPLTLTFEDYNNTEKIASLPQELNTENEPDGFEPEIGDFAYYVPWGNLSIFYQDFRYSERLVPLGKFESGLDAMTAISGEFTVTIEEYIP